jgi:hypothetical protein
MDAGVADDGDPAIKQALAERGVQTVSIKVDA